MTAPPLIPTATPPALSRPPSSSLRRRLASLLRPVGIAAGLTLLFLLDPASTRVFPACPFHRLTGLHCPACGSTRALHQLLHGRPAAAFDLNPFFVVLLPAVAYAFTRRAAAAASRRDPSQRVSLASRRAWAVLFAAATVFGVLRNLPWTPVAWMAP
jgi:hypothetical protein